MTVRLALTLAGVSAALLLLHVQLRDTPSSDSVQRENAYRQNNLGVAMLEQYDYAGAARAFRRALDIDADLAISRHNLALALYYDGQLPEAAASARAAAAAMGDSTRVYYVLGLIERASGEVDAARTAFMRVLAADPNDAGAKIQRAQLLAAQRQYSEAAVLFEEASRTEPFNATAAYGLATALTRAGNATAARTAMARFQQLRDDAAAITYSSTYLQEGRYGEAIASTGLELELVDPSLPPVSFVDVSPASLPEAETIASAGLVRPQLFGTPMDSRANAAQALARVGANLIAGVTLADLDRDGDLELIAVSGNGVRLYRNESGRFTSATQVAVEGTTPIDTVVGDFDNDGRPDLLVVGYPEHRLLRQGPDGTFSDASRSAMLPAATALVRSAAFADVDHDGDLDIVGVGLAAPTWRQAADSARIFPNAFAPARVQLLRNNGNSTFSDVTEASRLGDATRSGIAIVASDFDNRRDMDLLIVPFGGVPALFSNQRDGTFRDIGANMGWPEHEYTAVAAGDVNKDRITDLFLGRAGAAGLLALSDSSGRFTITEAPVGTGDALASQFLDYDNDGLLDMLVLTAEGPKLFRYLGTGWSDVTARAFPAPLGTTADMPMAFAAGDLDQDGDIDLVVRLSSGRIRVWRNEGGNQHASVRVRLTARVSNRSAVGATVELRAGSLYQKVETSATTPPVAPADVIFGLGSRARADVVRVVWPAGIVQAETELPSAMPGHGAPLLIEELDRKPSSCPYLFTWNGSRFEFVTDFLGGGEIGYWVSPGSHNVPDPDEYVRIPPGQLVPHQGRYELRITNELEEAVFLDRLQLVTVDHPSDTDIYPNEGLRSPDARAPLKTYTVQGAQAPARATDHHSHDVLDRITHADRRYVDDFRLEPVQGYAEEHSMTLEWEPPPPGARTVLLLTGWTDYAFSSDNVAAHQAGLSFRPPALQMRDESGQWQTVVSEIGLPVGRPQTVVLDLTEILAARNQGLAARGRTGSPTPIEVRIITTLRVYWDRILVDTSAPASYRLSRLDPDDAHLRWRGFSAPISTQGRAPLTFDYHQVSPHSPWKTMPGRYTREGDVTPLLLATDDRFVISAPGDHIALSFDADALPPLPTGWTRTFLLYADGFSKEMNLHSSSPDRLEPLPFHGMSGYPYPASEHYPRTPTHDRYRSEHNTRVIGGPLPPLERVLLPRPGATGRQQTVKARRARR